MNAKSNMSSKSKCHILPAVLIVNPPAHPPHPLFQIIGGIVLVITLPCVAPTLQSSSYVFTHFEDNLDSSGLPNGVNTHPPQHSRTNIKTPLHSLTNPITSLQILLAANSIK